MNKEAMLGIDAQSAWAAFTSRETTSGADLSKLQGLRLTQVASFVRHQIGGRYPSGIMRRGKVAVSWDSPTHFLFVEVLRDGRIRWELSDERVFQCTFEQGDEWDVRFEAAVAKLASVVAETRS